MRFLKVVVIVGLIFTGACALSLSKNDSSINYRLPDNVLPVHYNIKLIPYIEEDNFTFDGEISVRIKIRDATRDLSLHAHDLTIDDTATSLVNGDGAVRTPMVHDYDNTTQILTLNFDDELPPGHYILNMKFIGVLNDDLEGFFRTSYKDEIGNSV